MACGLTLNGCWDTRNYIESRRDNPLRYERIKNDLVEVRWWALESGAILAATAGGSALLYRVARLGRVAVPAN
ncbi:MAG TPA: hypothetical protein VFG68_18405 [Fimbriiglobus sp.]|nr:hypothetical protein [Fimbriiglobus sp.]